MEGFALSETDYNRAIAAAAACSVDAQDGLIDLLSSLSEFQLTQEDIDAIGRIITSTVQSATNMALANILREKATALVEEEVYPDWI